MSDAVEEIISEYVDALNAGAAEPVDVFLARFGGLEPATAAGLARTLSLLAGAAPALKDYGHRRASWQRLEALIEAQPAASGVGQPSEAEVPLLPGGASELHYHAAGAVRGSRIYIRPQDPPREPAAHPVIRWRPFAAALLLGLVALLLAIFGTARAPAPFFPERLIAPPVGSTVVPDGDSPDSPYSMVVEPLVADGNLVVLSYGAIEVGFSPEQRANRPLEVSADIRLTSLDGRPLPRLATGYGNSIMTRTQEFDASGLMVTATELDVRVVMTAFVGPLDTAGWHRPYGVQFPTPTPSVGPLPPKATVHVDRVLRLKFDPRRRIAEPRLTAVGRGITVTLERVVSTASETRFYYSGRPGTGERMPELRAGSRDFSMTEHGGVSYLSGTVREADGIYVLRVGAPLLDEPSPWVLTFPEVTTYDSIGLPPEKQTWIGPWVFYFAMPEAEASLTPGPLPSLPPATPRPTDVPGAVPTQQAPISGPVAPTALPTAAVDLPWLAQQAEVVARVNLQGSRLDQEACRLHGGKP